LALPNKSTSVQQSNKIKWNQVRAKGNADFYTTGYSTRQITELINLFCSIGVRSVIDIRFSPISQYRPEYNKASFLNYQLISRFFIDQCMAAVTGAHYPALNDSNFKKLRLVIPARAQQDHIAAYLDSLGFKLNEINDLCLKTKNQITQLVPNIVDSALERILGDLKDK